MKHATRDDAEAYAEAKWNRTGRTVHVVSEPDECGRVEWFTCSDEELAGYFAGQEPFVTYEA